MSDWADRIKFKYNLLDKYLSEHENTVVTPSVLQQISKTVGLNYASVKITAKKHNIKVKRSW